MKKRMFLVLTGLAVFIAVLGFVKMRQVQGAIAQQAAFQMPPEAVTTVARQAGAVAGDGRSASAPSRPSTASPSPRTFRGSCRGSSSSPARTSARARSSFGSTPGRRQAQLTRRRTRSAISPASTSSGCAACANRASSRRRTTTARRPSTSRPWRARARRRRRSAARRSGRRSPGVLGIRQVEPRPVPEPGRRRSCRSSRSTRST